LNNNNKGFSDEEIKNRIRKIEELLRLCPKLSVSIEELIKWKNEGRK
jgi:DNA-binding Xre family transcriptional regulator